MAKTDKYGDLRRRLVFLLLALVVYRIGTHIPVPGIDPNQLQQLFKGQENGILSLFNMFSGGALSRFSIFALGIMPYISASIIIFAGIAAGLPSSIGGLLELVRTGAMSIIVALLIVVLVAAITYFVVFVERGQRKILVNYARRQVGNKVYGGQSSHLPLKLNMAGVIPPIFASSIILLPSTIVSWFSSSGSMIWLKDISAALSPGQPIYVMLYAVAIIFFCFFYTALVFNSRETADNLKKSGGFIPGIRPGDQTARFIDKILLRLTFAGAIYITFVCLVPEFLILKYNVPFYFGGTSLLIIVVVTMDFMAQVQNYLMSQQYESLLKKANFKMAPGG